MHACVYEWLGYVLLHILLERALPRCVPCPILFFWMKYFKPTWQAMGIRPQGSCLIIRHLNLACPLLPPLWQKRILHHTCRGVVRKLGLSSSFLTFCLWKELKILPAEIIIIVSVFLYQELQLWLSAVSQGHQMFCHDLEVVGLNLVWSNLGYIFRLLRFADWIKIYVQTLYLKLWASS